MKSTLFSDACVEYEHPFRHFLVIHFDFCAFPVEKFNATVKTIFS